MVAPDVAEALRQPSFLYTQLFIILAVLAVLAAVQPGHPWPPQLRPLTPPQLAWPAPEAAYGVALLRCFRLSLALLQVCHLHTLCHCRIR